ncbi:MAG TPA: mechanosensitive ion channel [Candidatus Eubacterium avistercoris]|uniref:Mechanosensitive ion channel n=1 Tax=Candidatus Eubacterium avistercoris TaxID=2838567 RepID=A0A9D2D542_9FIRM|nr:mechanosensitive ion channel [Candidatus Eubacterium avistercoris]
MFFLSSENTIAEEVADVVSDNVKFVGWDTIRNYLLDKTPLVMDFVLKLIIAVIVILVGIRIIKFVRKQVRKILEKTNLDEGLKQFLDHLFNVFLYFVLIMLVLGTFGITASSVIAIIGSVGLSIGLALQGTLSNFAGGVLILLLKPFVVGDYIKEDTNGNEGTVSEIQLFYTKLMTVDNKTVILPNGTLSNCSLTNYTNQDKRMIDLKVGISYQADLKTAKELMEKVMMEEPARLENEEMRVFVSELGESSVVIGIRAWVSTENYWEARWRVIEKIKYVLDENGIEIPYPQMDVTIREKKEEPL